MEELNVTLGKKYKELKERKVVETQEWHCRHEADFRKYHLAVVELVEELKNEIINLQNEMAKREDAYAESQKLLLEERRKTSELSSEVVRCHELLSDRPQPCTTENGYNQIVPLDLPCNSPQTRDSVKRSAKKRKRNLFDGNGVVENEGTATKRKQNSANGHIEVENEEIIQSPRLSLQQNLLPDCCRTNSTVAGDRGTSQGCLLKCVYQTLLESLVGAKFSINTDIEQPCLSVSHLSSGYNFSLTWLKKGHDDDGEWYYQVSSLGTLERVAHEWMREDIAFSLTMCKVFFERVSRVIAGR